MKKIFFLIFAVLFLSCSPLSEIHKHEINSHWKLIYYNSDRGDSLKGNISDLINAVKNGKQVRIVMEKDSVIFAAAAEYLWVNNNMVYAQNNGQVSAHFAGEELVFQDNSYYWMFIVNTNGERNMIRWAVGEHEMKGQNTDRVFIKWYVLE
jgi:hypothetical protein